MRKQNTNTRGITIATHQRQATTVSRYSPLLVSSSLVRGERRRAMARKRKRITEKGNGAGYEKLREQRIKENKERITVSRYSPLLVSLKLKSLERSQELTTKRRILFSFPSPIDVLQGIFFFFFLFFLFPVFVWFNLSFSFFL